MKELVTVLKKYFNQHVLKPLFEEWKAGKIDLNSLLSTVRTFWEHAKDESFENIQEILGVARKVGVFTEGKPIAQAVESMLKAVSTAAFHYLTGIKEPLLAELESEDSYAFGKDWAIFRSKFFLPDNHPGIDKWIEEELKNEGITTKIAKKMAMLLKSQLWSYEWAQFWRQASAKKQKREDDPEDNETDEEWSSKPILRPRERGDVVDPLRYATPYDPLNPSAFVDYLKKSRPNIHGIFRDRFTGEDVEVQSFDGINVTYKSLADQKVYSDPYSFFLRHFVKASGIPQRYSARDQIIIRTCHLLRDHAPRWFEYISSRPEVTPKELTKAALLGLAAYPGKIVFAENAREAVWSDPKLETIWDLIVKESGIKDANSRSYLFENLDTILSSVLQ